MNVISITEHKNCALIFSFFFTSSSFYLHFVFHLLLVRVFHSPLSPDIIKPRRRYWINFSNPRECTKEVQNGNCKHILIYMHGHNVCVSVPRLNIDRVYQYMQEANRNFWIVSRVERYQTWRLPIQRQRTLIPILNNSK